MTELSPRPAWEDARLLAGTVREQWDSRDCLNVEVEDRHGTLYRYVNHVDGCSEGARRCQWES